MAEKDWKREAEYLQDELDRQKYQRERESERALRQREDERKERRQASLEAQCHANSWAEAFQKGIWRMEREAEGELEFQSSHPEGFNPKLDLWFTHQVEQHTFACDEWEKAMKAVEPRIQRIRERADRLIAALEQQARTLAADRTDQQFQEATDIGQNLRDNDFDPLVNW